VLFGPDAPTDGTLYARLSMAYSDRTMALKVVSVVAAVAFVVSASIVVITLVNGRPIPGVNALLVPAIVLGVAGGAWARFLMITSDTRPPAEDRFRLILTKWFADKRAWSGLPRFARGGLAFFALASFLVAASSNPFYGGYHNDPSLPLCAAGQSGEPACAPVAAHQHALAAHQRFVAAILAGVCTFVIGAALNRRRLTMTPSGSTSLEPTAPT
jgi:hypothetical protein